MFNLSDFEVYPELHSDIKKINKYVRKQKSSKLASKLDDLQEFLREKKLEIPITFILSILIEEFPEIFEIEHIRAIQSFIKSDNIKLKLNSIIIIGFFLLENPEYLNQKYISELITVLQSEEEDIRENCYYFLKRISQMKPQAVCKNKNQLLDSFQYEITQKNNGNLILLIKFLKKCKKFNFKQLYRIREIGINIIETIFNKDHPKLKKELGTLLNELFPKLDRVDFISNDMNELIDSLENIFIKKKDNFSKISKEKNISFDGFLESFKKSSIEEIEIYFYTKNRETKQIAFYELEKEPLKLFFTQESKISHEEILEEFSNILHPDELDLFIKTLVKLGHISGYLSEFYFYPAEYIISELIHNLERTGVINLKDFNYLPLNYVKTLVKDIAQNKNQTILVGKEKTTFYSLDNIKKKITQKAAKEAYIDLKDYQEKLTDNSFIRLIKHLPKEYLTNYHKRTYWLTNIGKLKFDRALENSRIIGFFDIERVSDKLNIVKLLLYDIFDTSVDMRSGLWNKDRTVFFYSKYLKNKIDSISRIRDEETRSTEINKLAQELDINREQILHKITENTESIGEEIKNKDQINISEYLEKTGMDYKTFIEYLNNLNLNFLKKGNTIIFNPSKIENAKKKVKEFVKSESRSKDVITLGTYDINSHLMKDIIEKLQQSGDIKGIFYEEDNEVKFYTEKGIKDIMLSNVSLFSFHDMFYGKELSEEELDILMDIFNELRESGNLKGHFDEETYTFTSEDIIFANTYMDYLDRFETVVNNYYEKFNHEFQKIKEILTKDSTIYPQEIKIIQDSINKINERYIHWRSDLDAFITRVNEKFLKDQGYSVKKYKSLSYMDDDLDKIRSFAEEERVKELMEGFNLWIKLFNKIELKYQNIIFYQKRLINNPEEEKTKKKLRELQEELNLI